MATVMEPEIAAGCLTLGPVRYGVRADSRHRSAAFVTAAVDPLECLLPRTIGLPLKTGPACCSFVPHDRDGITPDPTRHRAILPASGRQPVDSRARGRCADPRVFGCLGVPAAPLAGSDGGF